MPLSSHFSFSQFCYNVMPMFKLARVCVCITVRFWFFLSSVRIYCRSDLSLRLNLVSCDSFACFGHWSFSFVSSLPVCPPARLPACRSCLSYQSSFLPFLFSPSLSFVVYVCLCTAACYEALIYVALTFIPYLLIFY